MSITEVAKRAGVSSSTVSRVINNHPRVAPETEAAVRKAMAELSYTPSDRRPGPKPMSSRERAGKGNIAFLVFSTSRRSATPGFAELLRGVSQAAAEHNLNLSYTHVADPEQLPARLVDDGIHGLLLHGVPPGPAIRDKLRKVPTVWLMGNRRRPEWGDQVMPDSYEIGDQAARYLLEREHRRMAFMNLNPDHWPFRGYAHAFTTACREAGASVQVLEEPHEPSPDYWHPYNPDAVEKLAKRFASLKDRPTGVFVADDMQAALLQPVLQRHGVKIGPRQTELIACNNEEPYLIGLNPRPAVIDIRIESIGRRGVEQLIWRMQHPKVVERICTTIEPVVVRPDQPSEARGVAVG